MSRKKDNICLNGYAKTSNISFNIALEVDDVRMNKIILILNLEIYYQIIPVLSMVENRADKMTEILIRSRY